MAETFLHYMKQKDKPEPSKEIRHCPDCREPMVPGAVFCGFCGPPSPAEENPEKGLTLFQTLLRISLILALFCAIVVYKLDIPFEDTMTPGPAKPGDPHEAVMTPPPAIKPKDADFKVVHTVKASRANVRSQPNTGSEVVAKLERGVEVKVIKNGDMWSQVEIDGKTGYVASSLLHSEIR